jgi:hypothetical protein
MMHRVVTLTDSWKTWSVPIIHFPYLVLERYVGTFVVYNYGLYFSSQYISDLTLNIACNHIVVG